MRGKPRNLKAKVADLHASGLDMLQVAVKLNTTYKYVRRIASMLGLKFPRKLDRRTHVNPKNRRG